MKKYILIRFGFFLLNIWIIMTATFFLEHSLQGSYWALNEKLPPTVVHVLERKYGVDKPVMEQYVIFLKNALHGDFGISYSDPNTTVTTLILRGLPASTRIGLQILITGLVFGTALGILGAIFEKMWISHAVTIFVTLLGSVPTIIIAVFLQLHMGKYFPNTGWEGSSNFFPDFEYTVLPTIAGMLGIICGHSRFVKVQAQGIVNQEYITLAKAKGVPTRRIVLKHVIRNGATPFVTSIPPMIVGVLCGTFIIEKVFGIPGVGKIFVNCIFARNYPVVFGTTLYFSVLYMISLFCVDILYGVVDPRINSIKQRVNKSKDAKLQKYA